LSGKIDGMERNSSMNTPTSRPQLFGLLAGLFLAAGLCFASITFTRTWTHLHESQVIDVTGSARKNVRSDLVIWSCQFSTEAETLLATNERLKTDLAKVERFLRGRQITDYTLEPVQLRELSTRSRDSDGEVVSRRTGYQLTQVIKVRSADIDGVQQLSRDSSQLLTEEVTFVSNGITFIYTKASEAKVEMMAEATRDARTRAEQIATQGGRKLKELRTARMGVVQINPLYSSATSWEGNNDASSLDKTLTATVTATFSLQ
jgi:hypothetical protein